MAGRSREFVAPPHKAVCESWDQPPAALDRSAHPDSDWNKTPDWSRSAETATNETYKKYPDLHFPRSSAAHTSETLRASRPKKKLQIQNCGCRVRSPPPATAAASPPPSAAYSRRSKSSS